MRPREHDPSSDRHRISPASAPGPRRPAPGPWRRLTLLALTALLLPGCLPQADRLVIVSLDTVRRDHLPTYGYGRDTAPAVEELAQRGVVFDNAFAQDTNTNPSHASMFTGLYPHSHGSLRNGQRLVKERVTLAEILRQAGYRTGGFVSGAAMSRRASGLEQGFEVYEDQFKKRREGDETTDLALEWLRQRGDDESFFLFLHLYDAHGPYRALDPRVYTSDDPGPALEQVPKYQRVTEEGEEDAKVSWRLNSYVDRYDEMIRYVDGCLARLVDELDLERTAVVVLADHGETLGERYWNLDHGAQVFDEQIRIPLVLYAPGLPPRRIGAMAETIDLLPTLLELLRLEPPASLTLQGTSLVEHLYGEAERARDWVFSSARAVDRRFEDRGYKLHRNRRIHAVRSARYKLIHYPGVEEDYVELYDLKAEPGELVNVAAERTEVRDGYLELLHTWSRVGPADDPEQQIDPEVYEELKALGYID